MLNNIVNFILLVKLAGLSREIDHAHEIDVSCGIYVSHEVCIVLVISLSLSSNLFFS